MNFDISHHTLSTLLSPDILTGGACIKDRARRGAWDLRGLFNEKQLLYGSMFVLAQNKSFFYHH